MPSPAKYKTAGNLPAVRKKDLVPVTKPVTDMVPRTVTFTVDDPSAPRHLLAKSDLHAFKDLSADASLSWFLTLAAISLALSQNVFQVFYNLHYELPVHPWDALMSIVFAGALMGAIIKGCEYKRVRPKLQQKIDDIEARPTVTIDTDKLR